MLQICLFENIHHLYIITYRNTCLSFVFTPSFKKKKSEGQAISLFKQLTALKSTPQGVEMSNRSLDLSPSSILQGFLNSDALGFPLASLL